MYVCAYVCVCAHNHTYPSTYVILCVCVWGGLNYIYTIGGTTHSITKWDAPPKSAVPKHMMFGGLTSLWKIFGRRPCLQRSDAEALPRKKMQRIKSFVMFSSLQPSVKKESPPATSAVYDSTSALGSPRSGLTSRAQRIYIPSGYLT